MSTILDDKQILSLINVRKTMTSDEYFNLQDLGKVKGRHRESEVQVKAIDGSVFVLRVRQNSINPLDFSVILGYVLPNTNNVFRLRRYNGRYHEHKNKIEGNSIYDFHIHTATERYQTIGLKEDSFAEVSTIYSDLSSAIEALIEQCNIEVSGVTQPKLI